VIALKDASTTQPEVHLASWLREHVMKWDKTVTGWRKRMEIIAFEMEAGVWDLLSRVIVIKGVCDYADQSQTEGWQRYAAGRGSSTKRF